MIPATANGNTKVLVVDDNEDAADSLATRLGVMGYDPEAPKPQAIFAWQFVVR